MASARRWLVVAVSAGGKALPDRLTDFVAGPVPCREPLPLARGAQTYGHRQEMPEYKVWLGMRDRCENRGHKNFRHYGGRGIEVHETWRGVAGFDAFFEHIGARPSDSHTVERVDNSRGYEPGNVQWVTWTEQANNRRNNHLITLDGETMSAADWARRAGLSRRQIVTNRLAAGWDERAAVWGHEGELKSDAHERLSLKPTRERKPQQKQTATGMELLLIPVKRYRLRGRESAK
jgi:hypothetical protein